MIKEKIVFAVAVTTKHAFADFFQWFKNLLGMNLTSYEDMIEEATEQALYKLYKCYPDVYDVQITSAFTTMSAAQIIAYGKIKCQT